MTRYFFSVLIFCWVASLQAQLTVRVTAIPGNTPPGAPIHIVGNFNNWAPGDPAMVLSPQGNGQYQIVLNPTPGSVEFKFTRGSWATVEGNANGTYLPNRTFQYSGQATTLNLTILSWEDLGSGGGGGGTAAPNVYLLSNNFFMPQLNRSRRIWVYLPPDYNTANKSYPVLYMHDGQNLFNDATSAFGEWQVDESLNNLFNQGDYGCIVVGIDNGGAERLNEYSPWVNPQYGGGQGDAYIDFIVETLKPHIDSAYRTLPGRHTTGIMGSSMGGLISMYGLIEHQEVFSKAGILSSAFWFAGNASVNHVNTTDKDANVRVYFLAGGQEPASVAQNMYAVRDAMWNVGFSNNETYDLVPTDGQHSEWFWRREFPAAYQWLFAGAVSSTAPIPEIADLKISPNPVRRYFRIQNELEGRLQIIGMDSTLVREMNIAPNERIYISDLPVGMYILRLQTSDKRWHVGKMVKR